MTLGTRNFLEEICGTLERRVDGTYTNQFSINISLRFDQTLKYEIKLKFTYYFDIRTDENIFKLNVLRKSRGLCPGAS